MSQSELITWTLAIIYFIPDPVGNLQGFYMFCIYRTDTLLRADMTAYWTCLRGMIKCLS